MAVPSCPHVHLAAGLALTALLVAACRGPDPSGGASPTVSALPAVTKRRGRGLAHPMPEQLPGEVLTVEVVVREGMVVGAPGGCPCRWDRPLS